METTSMLTIPANYLRAALMIAPQKDVRFYLNGVFLQTRNDVLNIVATDGAMCLHGTMAIESIGDYEIIVPYDAVKTITKKSKTVTISWPREDGRHELDCVLFKPIDGRFPDYYRVIPTETSGEVADFVPEQIVTANKAMVEWAGNAGLMKSANCTIAIMSLSAGVAL